MKEKRVIISGGGTGGHLYPALVLGQKLQEQAPHLELTYVGSSREAEKNIMAHHKVKFVPMKIEGLKGRGLRSLKTIVMLPGSFLKSLSLLLRIKPDLVVGVGGFSSGPIVLLASLMKIPTLILEQNLRPGFTNRLLIPRVRRAVVAFEASLDYFKGKGVFLGNPVREEFYRLPGKTRTARLTLLIFGGSQGSHFLNQALAATLPWLEKVKNRLVIFHQTGLADSEWVKQRYAQHGFGEAVVAPYFHDMPDYFAKADLIISRAGATTCAELVAARKAALLIPFARASENHQASNAGELKRVGGAEVILEAEFTPQGLAERILDFLEHPEKIYVMEKNLARLKQDRAADRIAGLCFELMEARS
jgi:UDP-N-acetylglucosamine--N-acetylmuramyl-(pentapeptide) pyrophosphoryl-undecaprenol N-acetylglucosamine transferase